MLLPTIYSSVLGQWIFVSPFILARAAWFAYLNPKDTDLLYYNWFRRRDNWSPTEDLFDKGLFKIYFHYGSRDFTGESVDWFVTYRPENTPGLVLKSEITPGYL